jgi:DNA (cytosine-5)-methyltransferase 1
MIFTQKRPLRIGTDCSGIEAPIVALQQLKIPFVHEFSSEIDKYCISTIKANFNPKIIFGDMKQRKLKDIPDIDMYVCGFPCQPFSIAGKRDGIHNPRGTIFWECLRVIKYKKPIIFVLENVKGLLSIDNGETFKNMMDELKKIKIYNVDWKILNTADYGIPQSRKRVFIVGIRKKYQSGEFK